MKLKKEKKPIEDSFDHKYDMNDGCIGHYDSTNIEKCINCNQYKQCHEKTKENLRKEMKNGK